jgi:hypothetical protein
MQARGSQRTPCALITLAVLLLATGVASAGDPEIRFAPKSRSSHSGASEAIVSPFSGLSQARIGDWDVPAGQARREVLCPVRGYTMAVGVRPFFSDLAGSVKALSKGGEGTYLNLRGHLRLPYDGIMWELYTHVRTWDKVEWRIEYLPWSWSGIGHMPTEGNFSGILFAPNDPVDSRLDISTFKIGADYDVSFSREVVFGPHVDLHLIKWAQRVSKGGTEATDFSQTIIQPTIGAHIRYEPTNTGYFSWFKPYVDGRFNWLSFSGLSLSTWDVGLAVAPPLSRNVDGGVKLGYKQWKMEGNRSRLYVDAGVEGFFLDLSLRF